jgi:hypothetical protein
MQAALEAMALEIGPTVKVALWDKAETVPAVPTVPIVVVVGCQFAEHDESTYWRLAARLLETADMIFRKEDVSWVIEVKEARDFPEAYRSLVRRTKPNELSPALVYVPHHGSRDALLNEKSFARTLSLLKAFRFQDRERRTEQNAPDPKPLEAARARREQLLKDVEWLDAGQVHEQQTGANPNAPGSNNTASRLRRRGELLGAWNGREYLHPAFQFDPKTGRVMPEMKDLIALLPKDRGGWRQTFWLFQPHALLDGKRPADVFGAQPGSVIDAARSTFAPDSTNW